MDRVSADQLPDAEAPMVRGTESSQPRKLKAATKDVTGNVVGQRDTAAWRSLSLQRSLSDQSHSLAWRETDVHCDGLDNLIISIVDRILRI